MVRYRMPKKRQSAAKTHRSKRSKAASVAARAKWAAMTPDERRAAIAPAQAAGKIAQEPRRAEIASMGGKARAKQLTARQRSAIASKAASAIDPAAARARALKAHETKRAKKQASVK